MSSLYSSPVRRTWWPTRAILAIGAALLIAAPVPAQLPSDPSAESELEAQAGPKKHRKRQKRPVKMGTSGGNVNDFTVGGGFIQCCSGTLGSLLKKGSDYFVLSNNHVLAQVNNASSGDLVNQPGHLDNRCVVKDADTVAELTGYKKLKFGGRKKNLVDGAIAEVVEDAVDKSGAIVGIGVPGTDPTNPRVGMRVQKAGRTTGVTKGIVDALNLTGIVQYGSECSEDADILEARFVKAFIVVSTNNKEFSAGGDSGSLIVENDGDCPNPVGLLFAGAPGITVGNPINLVMKAVKKMKPKGPAEFVGCNGAAGGSRFAAQAAIPEIGDRAMKLAKRIQARTERDVLELPGVQAMGIGRSSSRPDVPVFKVFLDRTRGGDAGSIPREIDGVAVEVVETAPFRALNCLTAEPVG